VSRRIVLFGATGYTGEFAARAMVRRGLRPVLAGRRRQPLEALARDLGGLEIRVADAGRPDSVRALVDRGDVIVTTVGPMTRLGRPVLDAAIAAGADYVDSSGESSWVRHVFDDAGPRARAAGCRLMPGVGESLPGTVAAELALREAGGTATRVRVGYFVRGAPGRGLVAGLREMSGGSRATFASMALEPSFAWRGGRLVTERAACRVGVFDVDGGRRGISFGTTESYCLPRLHPSLREVDVYFGWFGNASRLLQAGSLAAAAVSRIPGARGALGRLSARAVPASSGRRADTGSGSLFVAEAYDSTGALSGRVSLEGINGYVFTGDVLAWVTQQVAAGRVAGAGTLGPLEAFGFESLSAGVTECGIAAPAPTAR
jgi:hypothetical protein